MNFSEFLAAAKRRRIRGRNRREMKRFSAESAGKIILMVDRYLPRYDEDAGSRVVWLYIKFFIKRGFRVVFFGTDYERREPYAAELEKLGVLLLAEPYFENGIHAWLADNAALIDYVIINRMHVMNRYFELLKQAIPQASFSYFVHDLVFLRESRDASVQARADFKQHVEILKVADLDYMRRVENVYVVSSYERDLILECDASIHVKQVPVYFYEEGELFALPAEDEAEADTARNGFIFVGGYGHSPNADAVRFLAEEIMPLITKSLPEAKLTVAGSYPREVAQELSSANLSFAGRVSDEELDRLYRTSRIALVPLRFGAGVKGKVIEAMHYGLPVVTTPIGAEGIAAAEAALTIRETAAALAEEAVRLHKDAALRTERTAHQNSVLEAFFSEETLEKIMGEDFGIGVQLPLDSHVRALLVPTCRQLRLVFPKTEAPVVSIIIPVHNQFDYTYTCLKSVLETCAGVEYEVILADDASTDKTCDIAQICAGIKVVRNPKPLLFLQNCNRAATESRGKYLVFLNNDVVVKPGWLQAMLRTAEGGPEIGIVGSKLLFADGTLQEAGGIIWKDGTGFNYGRGDDPSAPAYGFVREVDYVSGCSLLIRRTLWEEIGGFDERFSPAYYEDTDLAFEVRRRGYKVVYQPESVLTHFEGISNGRNVQEGIKVSQARNHIVFAEKWKAVLETEQFEVCTEFERASDRTWRRNQT